MSLDQLTAKKRASFIRKKSIYYNYHLTLKLDQYFGLAQITFYLQSIPSEPLPIDFQPTSVQKLFVNSLEVDPVISQNFLMISKQFLQRGKNRISVLYTCNYNNDQSGCISFIDGDKKFVYTEFEPYGANRVFPCFDQPDLKAYMKLTVVAPYTWRVLSNESPIASYPMNRYHYLNSAEWKHNQSKQLLPLYLQNATEDTKMTEFASTQLLPSYIFCFAAGQYVQEKGPQIPIPMSLFSVPSRKSDLQKIAPFYFNVTIKSMQFFNDYFGTKFPFNKYDQIFVRECGFSAMENAGIVTFNQSKNLPSFETEPTESAYYSIANVIAHELSHHWFGNYVTMEWWDDLWLNQSFADFISHFCLQKIKDKLDHPFSSSLAYFRDRKVWGYQEDQWNNYTHPIRGPVQNTGVAESIFDGITYAKGASTMKQLVFLVGQVNFSKGLKQYFDKFDWGNATILDLMDCLRKYFPDKGITIDNWREMWLQKPSLNVIECIWNPEDKGKNAILKVKQSSFSSDHQLLRFHKSQIKLYGNDVNKGTIIPQVYFEAITSQQVNYDGQNDIKAVLINYSDESFFQNILDPTSLAYFKQNILLIDDIYERTQVWYNIAAMVRMALISLSDYVNFLLDKLFKESSNFILQKLLNGVLSFLNQFTFNGDRTQLTSKIFAQIYLQLKDKNIVDVEKVQILAKNYVEFASTDIEIEQVVDWLKGKDPQINQRSMSLDLKWKTVIKVFGLKSQTKQNKQILFSLVKGQDKTESYAAPRVICSALICDDQTFDKIYQIFKNTDQSITVKQLLAAGWRNLIHADLLLSYRDRYFQDIITLSKTLKYEPLNVFYTYLKPIEEDFEKQVILYKKVVTQLQKDAKMIEHVANLRRMIDQLILRQQNCTFNSDTNLTLTQLRAINRSKWIKTDSINYGIHLAFQKGEQYSGFVQISFQLTQLPKQLPIDFRCEQLYTVIVNGSSVQNIHEENQFLIVPRSYLVIGVNLIAVHYRNVYDNDGEGCLSFIDAADSDKQYIYTTFEPRAAYFLFPCFDQPNLKAYSVFNIIVPIGWLAASNQIQKVQKDYNQADYINSVVVDQTHQNILKQYLAGKQGKYYIFQKTKLISTYLFALIAGQYSKVQLPEPQRYNKIPVTLYCLNSYLPLLTNLSNFIFQFTIESLKLYQAKFGVDYPFTKYDYAFCHQYKFGAMENPGLVTFSDDYLFEKEVPLQRMVDFAVVIAHECSHHWFGNYVTMDWWNDLWLNQSFADFISYYCVDQLKSVVQAIKYSSGWTNMISNRVYGYREDQMSTTHPVRSDVPNTQLALAYFDSITYEKGSACLKQLMYLMGEDNFFNGLKKYFKDFAWKNGTIDTFLAYMQAQYKQKQIELDDWKQMWLLKPSLNVLTVDWDKENKLPNAQLKIHQTNFSSVGTLRLHKLKINLYKSDFSFTQIQTFVTASPYSIVVYDGSKQYQAVLINSQSEGFVKYHFDIDSLNFFTQNLSKIQDAVDRMVIWNYLNQEVRESTIKVADFLDVLLQHIFVDQEDSIFQFQFKFLSHCLSYYVPLSGRTPLKKKIFDAVLLRLQSNNDKAIDQKNRIVMLKEWLPTFAYDDESIDILQNWRKGSLVKLNNIKIAVSQIWEVIKLVYTSSRYLLAQKQAKYNEVYKDNEGPRGLLIKNTCDALVADQAGFRSIYIKFTLSSISIDQKRSYSEGWNHPIHITWLKNYKTEYFKDIYLLREKLNTNQFQFFYSELEPIDDNITETIQQYESIKLEGPEMSGHRTQIQKIIDQLKVRKLLYKNS